MKKVFRIITKATALVMTLFCAIVFTLIIAADKKLSKDYFIVEGNQLNIDCQIPITTEYSGARESQSSLVDSGEKSDYSVNFRLFGVFPVSKANVTVIDNMSVKLLGQPFGIKIYTDGVLVVGMSDVDGEQGNVNPSANAGIKIGDTIKSINGKPMRSNEDVVEIVESSDGSPMTFVVVRDNVIKTITVVPIFSKSAGAYRIGLWVRDSTAGIGTLTFYSPATDIVCGLGHAVCDDDTGQIMSISSGELVSAEIISQKKGAIGAPGELKGRLGNKVLGELLLNCECGVYAKNSIGFDNSELMSIALKQDIKEGEAYIYTTIDGERPEYYTCKVRFNSDNEGEKTQNMVVTVTDKRLIEKTGGIVQGMSGSPIVQDGKLIGAVTHVFVNNPQKGYAIFAENMLLTAQDIKTEELNKAS
ncbi:MAG: SpoIVB peptidase [Ruminococcaceae bacterium]|nr:SpoIVB peptidase [Oscillospiraceae bacterium]